MRFSRLSSTDAEAAELFWSLSEKLLGISFT
ncbi:hypothetical protein J2X71_000061 [Rhizobium sp. 1399]|jgi:hypothetical protein|nr:hypothetical protein [Rhizobium sp. 1399]